MIYFWNLNNYWIQIVSRINEKADLIKVKIREFLFWHTFLFYILLSRVYFCEHFDILFIFFWAAMNFIYFNKVSVIFWFLLNRKLLEIPICYLATVTDRWGQGHLSCHLGEDWSRATDGSYGHVSLADQWPLTVSARQRRRFTTSQDGLISVSEPGDHHEPNGIQGTTK
jgi:hypothetical protein